jgi:hypothetical protein
MAYNNNPPLPAGAYRVMNTEGGNYWIVDHNGNIIGETGATGIDTYFTKATTDPVTGGVTGIQFPNGQHFLTSNQNSLLLVGDSRVAQGMSSFSGEGATGWREASHGFGGWMKFLSNGLYSKVVYAGRSGRAAQQLARSDTSTSYLDTLALSVIAPQTKHCLIWLGTNDIGANRTASQLMADILTIVGAATSSGKIPTVLCEFPRVTAGFTAAQIKELLKYQALLYKYSSQGYFYLLDVTPLFIDYTNTTEYALQTATRVSYDSIHPNNYGAYLIAQAVNTHYSKLMPPRPTYFGHHYTDDYSTDSANENQLANHMFPISLTGWTGASVAGAITAFASSRIADPDGVGYAMAMDISYNAATSVSIAQKAYNASPAYASGDSIFAEAKVWVQGNGGTGNPSGVVSPWLRLDITSGTGNGRFSTQWPENTTNEATIAWAAPYDGVLQTVPYYFNGNETSLSPFFVLGFRTSGAGSCRIIMSHPKVVKNNPAYLPNEWVVI